MGNTRGGMYDQFAWGISLHAGQPHRENHLQIVKVGKAGVPVGMRRVR